MGAAILAPMHAELLDVEGLYSDVPYSYAAIAPPGSTVFTAGACPLDAHGRVVAPGDIHAQMRQALSNLLVTLDAAACEAGDVVKTTVYVATTEGADLRKHGARSRRYSAMTGRPAPWWGHRARLAGPARRDRGRRGPPQLIPGRGLGSAEHPALEVAGHDVASTDDGGHAASGEAFAILQNVRRPLALPTAQRQARRCGRASAYRP